jgi:hypothetical protein
MEDAFRIVVTSLKVLLWYFQYLSSLKSEIKRSTIWHFSSNARVFNCVIVVLLCVVHRDICVKKFLSV